MSDDQVEQKTGDRIAKVMARAGTCSRREAERWIADGRVRVNGKVIDSPALNVSDEDTIEVDGMRLAEPEPPKVWRYHKPPGLVTTHNDPEGRPTVFDHLPADMPRVISVGRLDLSSEGLLLLTNDGELARTLEKPSTGWVRSYRVRAYGRPPRDFAKQLAAGVMVDGVRYGSIDVAVDRDEGPNKWYIVRLSEGKNREIRRVFEAFDLSVSRLIRTAYGPFELEDLKREAVAVVPMRHLRPALRETNFDLAAKQAGTVDRNTSGRSASGGMDNDRQSGGRKLPSGTLVLRKASADEEPRRGGRGHNKGGRSRSSGHRDASGPDERGPRGSRGR